MGYMLPIPSELPAPPLLDRVVCSLQKENDCIRERLNELVQKPTLTAEESNEFDRLYRKSKANAIQLDNLINSPQVTLKGEDILTALNNYSRRPRKAKLPTEPPATEVRKPSIKKPTLQQRIKEILFGKQPEGNYLK